MSKPVTIKAVLYWAQLHEINDMSGKYQVDLCQLSDAAQAKLTEQGVAIKNQDDDRGNYVTCKSTRPLFAMFEDGQIIDPNVKIGNGSKAVVALSFYEWTYKGKSGVSPSAQRIVVTDLIEYMADLDVDVEAAL